MYKPSLLFSALLLPFALQAQLPSGKLVLQKGDIIKIHTEMTSSNKQSMGGGEPMEMKTSTQTYTELEVKEVQDKKYILNETLKKMKMDFDGFGQKTHYDSESKEKQDNPFLQSVTEKLGVAEEIQLGMDGKLIEDPAKDKEKEGHGHKEGGMRGGGRMMKMNGMGNSNTAETAFLIVPADAITKGGWEETTEKDGLKTRRKYTIGGTMGNMVTVNVQSQTKGTIDMNRGGMPVSSKVNTLTEEMILVDIQTGKVQMHTIHLTNNGTTTVNGQENPSTGDTTITTTIE